MPYSSIDELPKQVQGLPAKAKRIWMRAFNSALKQHKGDEERASKIAWGAVKRVFKKTDGKWVAKSEALEIKSERIYSEPIEFEIKTDRDGKKRYCTKGFVAMGNKDKVDDILTEECIADINSQINDSGSTFFGSYDHEHIVEGNPTLPPRSRITGSHIATKNGYVGVIIEDELNPFHPEFENFKGMLENDWLGAYSIEFMRPKEEEYVLREDGGRTINKINLTGYAHTARPINPECNMVDYCIKSLAAFDDIKVTSRKGNDEGKSETTMAEEEKAEKTEETVKEEEKTQPEETSAEAPKEESPKEETSKETSSEEVSKEATPAESSEESPKEEAQPKEEASAPKEEVKSKYKLSDEEIKSIVKEEVTKQVKEEIKSWIPAPKNLVESGGLEETKSNTNKRIGDVIGDALVEGAK